MTKFAFYSQPRFDHSLGRRPFLVAGLAMLATACAPKAEQPASPLVRPVSNGQPLTIAVPNSDIAIAKNVRFVLGLLDSENNPIPNGAAQVRFFKIQTATTATFKGETKAFYSLIGPGDRGIYVTRFDFDEAGDWGVEVILTLPGSKDPIANRVSFKVAPQSKTPAVGAPAVASKQLTTADKPIDLLCSAKPPDSLHDLTVAHALANHKPTLILLGSPGFCASQTCGPNLEHVIEVRKKYDDRVQFIHIEIYHDAKPSQTVPAVDEWHLPSEPWTFLVDSAGIVVDKLEGGIALAELDAAVAKLLT